MARTNIATQSPVSLTSLPLSAGSAAFTMTALDASNGNMSPHTGREIMFLHNTSADTARTITVSSVADKRFGRTGDITTYSVAFGTYALLGPFPIEGFRQADGKLYYTGSHAELKAGLVRVPDTL